MAWTRGSHLESAVPLRLDTIRSDLALRREHRFNALPSHAAPNAT
jgi:hypothetical protein